MRSRPHRPCARSLRTPPPSSRACRTQSRSPKAAEDTRIETYRFGSPFPKAAEKSTRRRCLSTKRLGSRMSPDRIVNSMAKGKKLRQFSGADLVARIWQPYVEYRLDGTRRPAQHGHAIAEIHRLFDVVGDKDDICSG